MPEDEDRDDRRAIKSSETSPTRPTTPRLRRSSRHRVFHGSPFLSWRGPVHQRLDTPFLGVIRERVKITDLVQTPCAVQRIEIVGVRSREFAGLQIACPELFVLERMFGPRLEQVKPKPSPIHPRNPLGFSKERDENQ